MRVSRKSMPSVMYKMRVFSLLLTSSNRMVYPTSSPKTVPTSAATLLATEVAATRRGWVQAIVAPLAVHPASCRYWGSSEEV